MATLSNYMVKVTNAKMPQVKKALEAAGIEVRSILQVHKEETADPQAEEQQDLDQG